MDRSLDFDVLGQFLAFARGASEKDGLNCNAFKNADGSFLTLLLDEYQDASRALKTISILSSTLAELSRLVREGLASAREDLLPGIYKRGIYSLPFEVVAHIFELLHDDRGSHILLSANHYFRNIALKVPKLWTTVGSHQDPRLSLERSRSLGISVYHNISDPNAPAERFVDLLQPHLQRWKSFSILKGYSILPLVDLESSAKFLLQHLRDDNKGKTFPALETLRVDYGTDVPRGVEDPDIVLTNEEDPNASIRSFFHSWDLPALRCVDVVGFIPMLPSTCLRNLTCFRLRLAGDRVENMFIYDLQTIAQFLRSLSALEELSIDIVSLDEFINVEGALVEMPHLKTLDFYTTSRVETTLPLLDILSAPNLREMSISVDTITYKYVMDFFEALFPKNEPRWPQLETLSCSTEVTDIRHDDDFVPLNLLFTRLSCLRHLTIRTGTLSEPGGLGMYRYYEEPNWSQPPLQTLRILNCKMFKTSFILDLGKLVNASEFELLEIQDCPNINTEVVRELMPEGKSFICTEHNWAREIYEFKDTIPGRPRNEWLEAIEKIYAHRESGVDDDVEDN